MDSKRVQAGLVEVAGGGRGAWPAKPWYMHAFQEDYLDLYLHRDLNEAKRAVEFLKKALSLSPEHRLLDLCCGPGRHLVYLKRHVGVAVGLDLSRALLDRARMHCARPHSESYQERHAGEACPRLVQGDMQHLPLATGSFDRVVNLFTSFGYFDREAENLAVLQEVARILRSSGRTDGGIEDGAGAGLMAIDHINREAMLAGLVPRSERTLDGGRQITEKRHWDAATRRVSKEVTSREPGGDVKAWRESVRVYFPEELESLLDQAGLKPQARYGDYNGTPWSPTAPRLLIIARKK